MYKQALVILALLFCLWGATTASGQIISEDAAAEWEHVLQFPTAVPELMPHIVSDNASSVYQAALIQPDNLIAIAETVPRFITSCYPTSFNHNLLASPDAIIASAETVPAFITTSYATEIYHTLLVRPDAIISSAESVSPFITASYATDIKTVYLANPVPPDGDLDGDGMPNQWEVDNGLDYTDPSDADEDPDTDGLSNIDENEHNSDPHNPDTDNDGLNDGDEVNCGNDPSAFDAMHIANRSGDVTVSLTGENRLFIEVFNRFCIPKELQFTLSGLDQAWYTIDQSDISFTLLPFGRRIIAIQLNLPEDCNILTDTYPFTVQIDYEHGGQAFSASDSGNLIVTPNPNIYRLAIPEDTKTAGNNIHIAWKTDIPTDGYVYYRKLGDEDFIEVEAGLDSVEHRVLLQDLEFFVYYEYYTESHSSCNGLAVTDLSMVKTGKAVKFVDSINEFWVDRDYYQPITLTITNTDVIDHDYQLSVMNDNEDIIVDFIGDGSNGREASLSSGAAIDVELVVHAQDAQKTDYDIYLKLISDEDEDRSFEDYSHAIIHVRPYVANMELQPIVSTPGMMTTTFRLINYGDPLSDIEVYIDEASRETVWLEPVINHFRLVPNPDETPDPDDVQYVNFDIRSQVYASGTVYARSGDYVVSAPFEIGCPDGTTLTTHTLNNFSMVAQIKDWYCTNKKRFELPFAVPSGLTHDGLAEAAVELNFLLPMALDKYDPHTIRIYINKDYPNGGLVETLEDVIPQGQYILRFPTSFINLGYNAPIENFLTVEVEGIGEGQYIVATDFRIILNIEEMHIALCVPEYTPPPPVLLPPPGTKISKVDPDTKFRPGDMVNVEVELQNDDSVAHSGFITVTLENNSYTGDVNAVDPYIESETINVPPGNYSFSFTYEIPEYADDIDYTISVIFENQTRNQTVELLNRPVFYVRAPLIIIHGMMGSKLKLIGDGIPSRPQYLPPHGPIPWDPLLLGADPCDNFLDDLICNQEGSPTITTNATTAIKEFFRLTAFGADLFTNNPIFNQLETYLATQKYIFHESGSNVAMPTNFEDISISNTLSEDVFYFVYDWRINNEISAAKLKHYIETIIPKIQEADDTDYSKVNIIAHSMGGLVTKAMLVNEPSFQNSINKIIFVGTPNNGSVDAYAKLKYGFSAPYFDKPVEIELAEKIEERMATLDLMLSSFGTLSGVPASAISLVINTWEAIQDDEDYCNSALEITKVILDAINVVKLVVGGQALSAVGILNELYHLYNLDKDGDKIVDKQSKKLAGNMATAYQLLPNEEYFNVYSDGYFSENGVRLASYDTMAEFMTTPFFVDGDFVNPSQVANVLKSSNDDVPSYLRGQLSPATVLLLDDYDGSNPVSTSLYLALIDDLNQVLMGTNLYTLQEFQSVELSDETEELLGQNPQGDQIIHLNRLIIQDAFPYLMSKREIFNDVLLEDARSFHAQTDPFEFSGKSYAIIGCKKCTSLELVENGSPLALTFVSGDGDGTVPLESALNISVTEKYAAQYAEHINLPSQTGVRLLIRSLLNGHEHDFATDLLHPVAKYSEDFCGAPVCRAGAKINIPIDVILPELIIRNGGSTEYTYCGPNGVHIGILGTDYRITNEEVEVYVPEGQVYTLEFKGVDREHLNIKFQLMTEGGVLKTYIFEDITLDIDGCGEVTFDLTNVMTDPVLRLDHECDGIYELQDVLPTYELDSTESDDFIAPVTTVVVSGTLGDNDWYTSDVAVTLNVVEQGGSGLQATRYRFSGDPFFIDYSGPVDLSVPGTYTMSYYSIDRNLNKESEKILQIKLDNVDPQVFSITDAGHFNLGLADLSATIETSVGVSGLQDIEYSIGTAPGLNNVRDWTSSGTSHDLNVTGLSLVENCVDRIYINVRIVNGAGVVSEIVSSDGVIMLEPGGDPDADGFVNEAEIAAGSNPCNIYSIPKDTTITLQPGFNLVTIPAEVLYQPNLNDWMPVLGTTDDIESVMVFNVSENRFITLVPDNPGNPDYTLIGGGALIVYARQETEIDFTSVLCNPLDLDTGFNFVGFACPPAGYSAYQILNDHGEVYMAGIQRYNTVTGNFESAGFNQDGIISGINFPIVPGEGYTIFMKQTVQDFTP